MINKPSAKDLAEADRIMDLIRPFWRLSPTGIEYRDDIASALASARTAAAEDMRERAAKCAEQERENPIELRHLKTCSAIAASIRALPVGGES